MAYFLSIQIHSVYLSSRFNDMILDCTARAVADRKGVARDTPPSVPFHAASVLTYYLNNRLAEVGGPEVPPLNTAAFI